jgi:hypothetical protein
MTTKTLRTRNAHVPSPSAGTGLQILCDSVTAARDGLVDGAYAPPRREEPMLAPVLSPASLAPIEMPDATLDDPSDEARATTARRQRLVRIVMGVMGLCAAIGVAAVGASLLGHGDDTASASVSDSLSSPAKIQASTSIAGTLAALTTTATRVDLPTLSAPSPATNAHSAKKKAPLRPQPATKRHATAKPPAKPNGANGGSGKSLEELLKPVSHGNARP